MVPHLQLLALVALYLGSMRGHFKELLRIPFKIFFQLSEDSEQSRSLYPTAFSKDSNEICEILHCLIYLENVYFPFVVSAHTLTFPTNTI